MNDCGKIEKEDLKYFNIGFETSKKIMEEYLREHKDLVTELRKKIYGAVLNQAHMPKSMLDKKNLLGGLEVGISDAIIDLIEGKE